MALDSDNVRVAVTGAVYVAPTGTTAPTASGSSLDAAFIDLGYVSSDGITEGIDKSTTQIRSWQDGSLVRATGGRQSFVVDVIDGSAIERIYIPSAEITSVGERTLASGEAIGYNVTITAYADASSDVATKFFSALGG